MGICQTKSQKEKAFNHLKNSVVLTKQKTDKKNDQELLKQLNENYIGFFRIFQFFAKFLHIFFSFLQFSSFFFIFSINFFIFLHKISQFP